jgi:hypothetical protein
MPADKGAAMAPTTPGMKDACKGPTGHECGERVWLSADYLLWWIKGDPVNVPLVLNQNPYSIAPAGIGNPAVTVVYGPSTIDYGAFSGGQMQFGYWFDQENTVALEMGGFLMEAKGRQPFSQTSGPNGQGLAFSYIDPVAGEAGYNVNFLPGQIATITVQSTSRFSSGDLNLRGRLLNTENYNADVLLGFRYFDLRETLTINSTSTDPGVTPFFVGNVESSTDAFSTKNQFYAGQLGLAGTYRLGQFSIELSEKAALGTMHEILDTDGAIQIGAGSRASGNAAGFPGSLYASPSNIGEQDQNQFAFLTDTAVDFRYALNGYWALHAGCNFLYLTDVIRPGNQIDRVINPNNAPLITFPTGGPANTAPFTPVPQFNHSNFIAGGISLGASFRY